MNFRKQITETKTINVMFLLYLNLIIPIIAIKQFDEYNNIHKNIQSIEKNIDDLFSSFNNLLNTTFLTSNNNHIYITDSNLDSNQAIGKKKQPTSHLSNTDIILKDKLKPFSSYINSKNNLKIGNHISSFIQTSLSNKNDTNTQVNKLDNTNNNIDSSSSSDGIPKSLMRKNSDDQIAELLLVQNNTLNKGKNIDAHEVSLLSNSSNQVLKNDNITQMIPTKPFINNPINKTHETSHPPYSRVNTSPNPQPKINVTLANSTRVNSTQISQMKTINNSSISTSANSQNAQTNNNKNIKKSSCPNNCSGKGLCVNGNCYCLQGFTTEDCSKTYKDYVNHGIKLEPNIKWLVIVFFGVFVITLGLLLLNNCSSPKAGDHLELD